MMFRDGGVSLRSRRGRRRGRDEENEDEDAKNGTEEKSQRIGPLEADWPQRSSHDDRLRVVVARCRVLRGGG